VTSRDNSDDPTAPGPAADRERCCGSSGCGPVSRRAFVGAIGLGLPAAATVREACAGPFALADFEKLVPPDKKLDPDWVKRLFERGGPEPVTGPALQHVGMPVGGLFCGTVYLSGDGRLWHWDIFNRVHVGVSNKRPVYEGRPLDAIWGSAYVEPLLADEETALEQGVALTVKTPRGEQLRPLDATGFSDVSFVGQYPIGTVRYTDPDCPVQVVLEAFSPFAPLETDESSLPVTVLHYELANAGAEAVEVTLAARLENAAAKGLPTAAGDLVNAVVRTDAATLLAMSLTPPRPSERPDIPFEDWSKPNYEGWTVEGEAFGAGPIARQALPAYQGDVGGDTPRVVNSHATAPGADIAVKDGGKGRLTSRSFRIERRFVRVWIGGGDNPGQTCVNLLVDGKPVRSVTGHNANQMRSAILDAGGLEGREARIEIVDAKGPGWGNVGVGRIIFTDNPQPGDLAGQPGFGSLCLALVGAAAEVCSVDTRTAAGGDRLVGSLGRRLALPPGGRARVTFLVAWHFPNVGILGKATRHYAAHFGDAAAVAGHVAENIDRLAARTRLWRDTWYDSTLPWWLLDRTFANTANLATSTCHRFADGRLWTWEGVGCCPGTCGHVWHYAQATGRLFPDVERDYRRRVDFAIAQHPDGAIGFRAESGMHPAIDAQAGTILRTLREHQMSADGTFLEGVWPGVRRATEWLISQDGDGDGLIEGGQHNTLDANWYGPVAWLSGLYLAALLAAAEMADERGDAAFAGRCREIAVAGRGNLVARLFEGDYFVNVPDPRHPEAINSGTGCHIDQVMGQHWAWQVGLGRVLPERETRSALKSLWRFNFTPDVGPYRAANRQGRWYAVPGEGGLLMCTFPRADWNYTKAAGKGPDWAAGYFNECMSGFEYQAAGHMLWEGLALEGLAVARAIHDRYHPSRRNPYNEVECSDHYVRAMASYGLFQAACGFTCHGPRGQLAFAPRLTAEDFRAAFVGPTGWGTFRQRLADDRFVATLEVKHGELAIESLALAAPVGFTPRAATSRLGDAASPVRIEVGGGSFRIVWPQRLRLEPGAVLEVAIA